MIVRYDFGKPYQTDAVVHPVEKSTQPITRFTVQKTERGLSFSRPLAKKDIIFGLGETVRGINKRGHLYRSWNSDEFSHLESKQSLYASHNLLIFFGEDKPFGVFFDDPGSVLFDLGYTDASRAEIISENGDVSVYVIEEDSLKAITRAFRELIGRSYVPPKWAMGYLQSRWGYAADGEVRSIVAEHRKRHIPLDGVCLDIDYMDNYKDFTWNTQSFPDMAQLNADMKGEHVHLIPIIDAGVKEEEGYDVCDEGLKNGYFCTREDGKPFVGAVWPGRSLFPDFLKADARAWFGDKYHKLMAAGVEGFWNDMNEPALFYSVDGLQKARDEVLRLMNENIGLDAFFALKDAILGVANNPEDYRSFYHELNGERVRHDKVHNLYGAFMTRSAAEGLRSFDESKRFLLFARASYIGAHRYGGVWQGDNSSWWSHLLLNLKMLPSLNMCGFLFTGADLGGFSSDTTEDLLLRWLQLGVFTPLMRNHSALHTRDQEIYRFGMQDDMRRILSVRYGLIPYLYSELMKCAMTNESLFRPLAFDYPTDEVACHTEDQVMLGGECMIAPVYEQNAIGRHVYLPEDMLMVRFRAVDDYDLTPMAKGHHWVALALNEMPLFIRRGAFIPLSRGAEWVEAIDAKTLTLLGWLNAPATYELYDDDGVSQGATLEGHITAITVDGERAAGEGLSLDLGGIVRS